MIKTIDPMAGGKLIEVIMSFTKEVISKSQELEIIQNLVNDLWTLYQI